MKKTDSTEPTFSTHTSYGHALPKVLLTVITMGNPNFLLPAASNGLDLESNFNSKVSHLCSDFNDLN